MHWYNWDCLEFMCDICYFIPKFLYVLIRSKVADIFTSSVITEWIKTDSRLYKGHSTLSNVIYSPEPCIILKGPWSFWRSLVNHSELSSSNHSHMCSCPKTNFMRWGAFQTSSRKVGDKLWEAIPTFQTISIGGTKVC